MNLTPRQLRVLEFVRDFLDRRGYAPTLEEIASAFAISKITALQHLRTLEKRGAIRRTRYQARSIELCEPPTRGDTLPLKGIIAAGEPIEAVEDPEELSLADLLNQRQAPFLLRVRGDSMIDEQIRDGDYVVCEARNTARNGETVVAILDDNEATLKKYYMERNGRVRLQPANESLEPVYPEELEIRGVVVGVLRKY